MVVREIKEYHVERIYRIKMTHGLYHLNGRENLKIDTCETARRCNEFIARQLGPRNRVAIFHDREK